jgi:hypothetical protein
MRGNPIFVGETEPGSEPDPRLETDLETLGLFAEPEPELSFKPPILGVVDFVLPVIDRYESE